jgi:hypothetical protein
MQRIQSAVLLLLAVLASPASASPTLWTPVQQLAQRAEVSDTAKSGRYYHLEMAQLRQLLDSAGHEEGRGLPAEITLPMSDGSLQRFSVVESPIMAPHIAARFPDFKTYKIQGIDDPLASGRLSLNPSGFRGMVNNVDGVSYIDSTKGGLYRQYARKMQASAPAFKCGVKEHDHMSPAGTDYARRLLARTPGALRKYRIAVAATAEYVAAIDGTQTGALAEINNAINRVNQIFERDLGVRLELVTGIDVLYTNSATDPYTDDVPDALIEENQRNLDSVVGDANYDIGHVFSTGGGGFAAVGVTCDSGFKGKGVTGISDPTGETFYIDFVAHEIGHQFDATHSFNGTTFNCGGSSRESSSAWEPGSGSTIMAYAGICREENIQLHSDALFHAGSIAQIDNYVANGVGNSCGSNVSITNPTEPTVNAGSDYTIPASTPFALTAIGSGEDSGETLQYTWDQMDVGSATTPTTLGQDLGSNTLFRSYLPRAQNYRHFPALSTTLSNLVDRSEVLPCQARDLNFRVTVRDGRSGQHTDNVKITVDANSGPFSVTSFNDVASIPANQSQVVSWNVAGTNAAPVNCSQVDISLLTFNSNSSTYAETLLLAGTPNDGSEVVNIPDQTASRARIKVQCSNNVFYDISNRYMTILGSASSTPFPTSGKTAFANSLADPDMLTASAATCPSLSTTPTATASSSGGGGGAFFTSSSGDGGGGGPLASYPLAWLFGLYAWRRLRVREYTSR